MTPALSNPGRALLRGFLAFCFVSGLIQKTMGQPDGGDGVGAASYPFQEKILEYVLGDSIPSDGRFVYYWPRQDTAYRGDTIPHLGTARNVDYLGTRLSTVRENQGTHCVGITWQVGMSVLGRWASGVDTTGAIVGMSLEDMQEFVRRWFVKEGEGGALSTPEETGVVYALESFGLGRPVAFEDARAGDFVQFWRMDGSGHSCVFLHWVYDAEGNIMGFHYWGSQPHTDGIGTDTEYFAPSGVSLDPERLLDRNRFYIGRLAPEE